MAAAQFIDIHSHDNETCSNHIYEARMKKILISYFLHVCYNVLILNYASMQ